MKIKQFINRLYEYCKKDTCYPEVAGKWSEDNKFYGHCAIVALIINDYFGGKIVKCKLVEENISHFYNEIDCKIIDATISQYNYLPTKVNIHYVNREEILDNPNTLERYSLLKNRIK